LLSEREAATGAQVVVAVFPSLEGESLEDFSIRLAQRWRIGQKGLDDGAILVVFVRERRVRLEVGYGLEPVVPDAVAGRIIRESIAPHFREGRYAAGLEAAVTAVYDRIGQEPGRRRAAERPPQSTTPPLAFLWFVVLMVIIAAVLFREAASSRRFVRRNGYTVGRGGGWSAPVILPPVIWGGRGGWGGGGGGGGFSGGGGSFGGGGASGDW
jgi:uncharacterized protein